MSQPVAICAEDIAFGYFCFQFFHPESGHCVSYRELFSFWVPVVEVHTYRRKLLTTISARLALLQVDEVSALLLVSSHSLHVFLLGNGVFAIRDGIRSKTRFTGPTIFPLSVELSDGFGLPAFAALLGFHWRRFAYTLNSVNDDY